MKKAQEQPSVKPSQRVNTTSNSSASRSYTDRQTPKKEEQPRYEQSHQETPRHNEPEDDNGFIKTVVMIGGAVLALAAVLFAIFK